jgi:GNAT superfamily N-acetyltransferase
LYGKSIRERCFALIEIAHPDDRPELFHVAQEHQYISKSQPGNSFRSLYPEQYECYYTSRKTKRVVYIRPIKIRDDDLLRTFFHKLSDHSVYLRYFRKLRSMSYRVLQQYTDIDYTNNMALIALYPIDNTNNSSQYTNNTYNRVNNPIAEGTGDDHIATSQKSSDEKLRGSINEQIQYEMVGIVQWISSRQEEDGVPEIAFQVRDDWQGEGLGSFLFHKLVDTMTSSSSSLKGSSLKGYAPTQMKADVLYENISMRHLFEKSNIPYRTSSDFGVVTYTFDLIKYTTIKQQEFEKKDKDQIQCTTETPNEIGTENFSNVT